MRKPSMTGYDGKYDKFIEQDGGGTIVWQPGDGTRYVLWVRAITDADEAGILGCAVGDLLVVLGIWRGMAAFFLSDGVLHHESYVAEKLAAHGITDVGQVMPVVALLNLAIGDEEYGREMFMRMQKARDNR